MDLLDPSLASRVVEVPSEVTPFEVNENSGLGSVEILHSCPRNQQYPIQGFLNLGRLKAEVRISKVLAQRWLGRLQRKKFD